MPPAIDYRRTFLRRHIQAELHTQPQDDRRREEVLALDNLRHRLGQAFNPRPTDEELRSAVTVCDFFYGGGQGIGTNSGVRLYLEVPVTRLAAAGEEKRLLGSWRELTHLLRDEDVSPRGVVLRARSGAGKTTAMLKAFHDCLFSAGGEPLLGGRLPCYLRDLFADSLPIRRALKKQEPAGLIERMVLQAAGWPSATPRMIKGWLSYSPPLLIFLDLNTAAEEVALLLAESLPAFQRRWAVQGHRCVVAYRSFGEDTVYKRLHDRGGFAFYDLQPLPYSQACAYLTNLAPYETWLRERLAAELRRKARGTASEYDLARLEHLAQQHVRGDDGVLSTPLLVHLFSMLRGPRQQKVHCLADMYHEVVEEYLDRDYGPLEDRPRLIDAPPARNTQPELRAGEGFGTAEGRTRLKAALVRVALAILGQTAKDGRVPTRLLAREKSSAERVLDTLLEAPNQLPYWWPSETEWHTGMYFEERYSQKRDRLAIKRRSLLRLDGSAYAFLHDSFLYWFAALGLRCSRIPEPDLSPLDGGGPSSWFRLDWRPCLRCAL